ncbi:MAG: hypothetical protein H8F28_13005 [Fibrella sp.]|nr:hypothetical protein [Armatimonadota bacterium]
MNAETYLRRALFAPIIVPLLAGIQLLKVVNKEANGTTHWADQTPDVVAMCLFVAFCIGGVPYIWMLFARWEFFRTAGGGALEEAWKLLPLAMLPFYWKFWGVVSAILIVTLWGALAGLAVLVIGTIAVPILGYAYVAVTFCFLRIFQWLGLIHKEGRI